MAYSNMRTSKTKGVSKGTQSATTSRRKKARGSASTRIPVKSESIASIGYEPAKQILEVEFRSRELYHYYGVPQRVFVQFMKAESKGRYFMRWVREKYRYKKIEQGPK
jgi:hypothetical protein